MEMDSRAPGSLKAKPLFFPALPFGLLLFASLFFWYIGDSAARGVSWLCLITLVVGTRYIFKYSNFPGNAAWFFASFGAMFLLFPAFSAIFNYDMGVADNHLIKYGVLAVGGISLFFLGYEYATRRLKTRQTRRRRFTVSKNALFSMMFIFALLNVVSISIHLVNAGGLHDLMHRSRLEHRLEGGLLILSASYIMVAGGLFYTLMGIVAFFSRYRLLYFLPLMIFFDTLFFLALRTRTPLVLHFVAFGIGYFVLSRRIDWVENSQRRREGMTVIQRLLAIFCVIILVVGAVGLRSFRGNYEAGKYTVDFQKTFAKEFFKRGTFNSTELVFSMLYMVPDRYEYLKGQSYYRLLFIPVPRFIWPDKPPNTQRITAKWLDPDSVVVQTTPVGVHGDLYINFGMWGTLGFLIYGLFWGWLDRSNKLWYSLFASVSFPFVYHFVRGGFTNPVILMVLLILVSIYTSRRIQQPELD